MAHGYRTLQNWDSWLTHEFLGSSLLKDESVLLARLLKSHYGKHALLLGVPGQQPLLQSIDIPCRTLMSPPIQHAYSKGIVESDFHELPILSGSIDLVILPHTLEFVDNPRQLLAEACRIVKPEGLIAVCGFNPYGTWGVKKWMSSHQTMPWAGNFIPSHKVKGWLRLADFALEDQSAALFRPPLRHTALYQKLQFIEKIGHTCFSIIGGAYILLARAKVIPLTPIKMKWKQQLSGIRISSTISGHIARRTK